MLVNKQVSYVKRYEVPGYTYLWGISAISGLTGKELVDRTFSYHISRLCK